VIGLKECSSGRGQMNFNPIIYLLNLWIVFCFFSSAFAYTTHNSANYVTFTQCVDLKPEDIYASLNSIASEIFEKEVSGINYDNLVRDKWYSLLDNKYEELVKEELKKLKEEMSVWDRVKTSFSAEKNKEYANKVLKRVFSSPQFLSQMELFSSNVSKDINTVYQNAAQVSTTYQLGCIFTYLGTQYTKIAQNIFREYIRQRTSQGTESAINKIDVSLKEVALNHGKLGAGVGLLVSQRLGKIIVGRISRRITKKVTQKITMRLLGKLAGPFGILLLAWDAVDIFAGELPFEDILLKEETKEVFIHEIAKNVREEVSINYPEIAKYITENIYRYYIDFRNKYNDILQYSKTNPSFESFVETLSPRELENLVALFPILKEVCNDNFDKSINGFIEDGTLEKLLSVDSELYTALKEIKNVDKFLKWIDLLGPNVNVLIDFSLYKRFDPDRDKEILGYILLLKDNSLISKCLSLDSTVLHKLTLLDKAFFKSVMRQLSQNCIVCLTNYIGELSKRELETLLTETIQYSGCSAICRKRIFEEIVNSDNKEETIKIFIGDKSLSSFFRDIINYPHYWKEILLYKYKF